MSEELELLIEYARDLGLSNKTLVQEDLDELRSLLKEVGEFGLANFVGSHSPQDIEDYVREEE